MKALWDSSCSRVRRRAWPTAPKKRVKAGTPFWRSAHPTTVSSLGTTEHCRRSSFEPSHSIMTREPVLNSARFQETEAVLRALIESPQRIVIFALDRQY